MGLTIHYSGTLRNPELLPTLIQEATDIAESLKWPYEIIEKDPDIPVEGILISPEGSEPLWLTFHEQGFMCNPMLYSYVMKVEGKGIPTEAEQWLFTKTQYAGVEAHIAMIKLLRYLSQQYFERFELHDESQFWETNDEVLCREIFAKYDFMMNAVGEALEEMEIDPNASQETVIGMIEKMLGEKFKR
jgi:hypothetical protein